MMISNIRENGEPIGALPDGEMMFHHDMIHAEVPSKATLLYSVEIPSTGGNTLFASRLRRLRHARSGDPQKLEGKKALHHYNYGSTVKGDSRGTVAFSEQAHPVFRTHEDTGRKAVYVNRLMTVKVLDMPEDESERLLNARLRSRREARIRLRARLARRRSVAVGQSLLVARAHRFSLDRAAADVSHHGRRQRAALLSMIRKSGNRFSEDHAQSKC